MSTIVDCLWYSISVNKIDPLVYKVDATTLLNSFNLDPLYMLMGWTCRPAAFFCHCSSKIVYTVRESLHHDRTEVRG